MEAFLEQFPAWLFYVVVWGIVYAETGLLLGFLLPGDSLLFAAGLLAARPGGANAAVVAAGVFVAAVAGDQTGYSLGIRFGRPYTDRRGPRIREGVARAEEFYRTYGWLSLVAARFIPWVRTFTPFVAGVARMHRGRFLAANVVGALCWGVGLVALGYWAYQVPWLRDAALVIAVTVVMASVVGGLVMWWRGRASAEGR
ncbi:MAG: rane-associated protein [Actinomycetota bacterium]|nr:rane-associated protein [Actinomycetota bacterium]